MYPLGLLPLLQAWIPDHAAVKLTIALPSVSLLVLLFTATRDDEQDDCTPTHLPLSAYSTIWPFFRSRFDFIAQGFQLTGKSIFQFGLLKVKPLRALLNLRLIIAATEYRRSRFRRIWQKGLLLL